MFRYGFEGAVKQLDYSKLKGEAIELNLPEPYIIVLEEDDEDLKYNNMYILLPVSIIKVRQEMEKLNRRNKINLKDREKIILARS